MKKSVLRILIATTVLAMAVASCSYYTYPVSLEKRGPSKIGMDLSGRSISVSFVHDSPADSIFQARMAEGFVSGIEETFFSGERAVEMFAIKKNPGALYASRDTMTQLVMSTDADLVFLFDSTQFVVARETGDTILLKANLYAYDSMDKADTVRLFYGKKTLENVNPEFAESLGHMLSKPFESTWETETYQLYFYDEQDWIEAATFAVAYEWTKALNKWAEMLSETKNLQRRAFLSYNIALSCYMLEDFDHAVKWLDRAEKDGEVAQAKSLRHHISERINN